MPLLRSWGKLAALVALVGLGSAAVFGVPRAKRWWSARACRNGVDAACEQACAAGEAGEGGCLDAAQRVEGPYEARRARRFVLLDRACQLGEVAACRQEINTVRNGDLRIEGWATQACVAGDVENCKVSAALALARHPERLDAAVARLCEVLPGDPAARQRCSETWRAQARQVATARSDCAKRQRGACSRLGAALLAHDATAALEAYAAECELRGLSGLYQAHAFECGNGLEWYHGPAPRSGAESCGFELLDADTAARATLRYSGLGTPPPVPPASPPQEGFFALPETAAVRLVITPADEQLQSALSRREPAALACLDPKAASAGLDASTAERARELRRLRERTYTARFVVDRFGEVPLRTIWSALSTKETDCLTSLYLSNLAAPSSGRRVELFYNLTAK